MRILKESLPDLSRLSGQLKKADCFACVWHIFTNSTPEERSALTAGLKKGMPYIKIIEVLTRLYPEIDWEWKEMDDNRPNNWSIQFNQAAIVFYKELNRNGTVNHIKLSHYAILTSNQRGIPIIYDPQIKEYTYVDDLEFEFFFILNGYKKGTRELWEGQLPNRLTYSNITNTPSFHSEMEQFGLYMHHQNIQIDNLFRDPRTRDDDIIYFNLIGEDINRTNKWDLTNKRDKKIRRILNDKYMKLYRQLLQDGINVVKIEHPLHVTKTNYSSPPPKSKSKSKFNSASVRKHKRKLKRTIRLRTLEEYPENN